MKKTISSLLILGLLITTVFMAGWVKVNAATAPKPVTIRFFVGGDAGDAFASIVYKGAMDAAKLLGNKVKVDYVFSGWQTEKMVSQLREAIAAQPDGIAMMGHPGEDAIMPLAQEAAKAGIIMMYQNVDVPAVRAKFGGGYVGIVDLGNQGKALAEQAVKIYGFKKGDHAVVFGAWGQPGRYFREEGSAKAFEAIGMKVERVIAPPSSASDPQQLLPLVTGQLTAHPDVKVIVFPGSQNLSMAEVYMKAANKKPGEVKCIGFDLSPAILDGFKKGYVQLTADQQPYMQGYLPIMSIYLTKTLALSPITFDTGAGLVDVKNYARVTKYVQKGTR